MQEEILSPYLPAAISPEREERAHNFLVTLLDGLRELGVGDANAHLKFVMGGLPNFALDGSIAAGKTTISEILAKYGEFLGLSAGLFYRLVTRFMLDLAIAGQNNLNTNEHLDHTMVHNYLAPFINDLKISIIEKTDNSETKYCFFHPRLGKRAYTESQLREGKSNEITPIVAETPLVIAFVDTFMGSLLLERGGLIVDGRTWYERTEGADFVGYLTTQVEVAAQRQTAKALRRHPDTIVALEQLSTMYMDRLVSIIRRNETDQGRAHGQLLPVEKAVLEKAYDVVVDTSNLSPTEVTVLLLAIFFEQKVPVPPQGILEIIHEVREAYGHAILAGHGKIESRVEEGTEQLLQV